MVEWLANVLYWIEDHKTLVQSFVALIGPSLAAIVVVMGWRVNAAQARVRDKRATLIELAGAIHAMPFVEGRLEGWSEKLLSPLRRDQRASAEAERTRSLEAVSNNDALIRKLSTAVDIDGVDMSLLCLYLTLEPNRNPVVQGDLMTLILDERRRIDKKEGVEEAIVVEAKARLNEWQKKAAGEFLPSASPITQ